MTAISTLLPTYATINLTALAHNLSCIKRYLSPGCQVMAIIKANAYGHGVVETAQALARQGIERLAVASLGHLVAVGRGGDLDTQLVCEPMSAGTSSRLPAPAGPACDLRPGSHGLFAASPPARSARGSGRQSAADRRST